MARAFAPSTVDPTLSPAPLPGRSYRRPGCDRERSGRPHRAPVVAAAPPSFRAGLTSTFADPSSDASIRFRDNGTGGQYRWNFPGGQPAGHGGLGFAAHVPADVRSFGEQDEMPTPSRRRLGRTHSAGPPRLRRGPPELSARRRSVGRSLHSDPVRPGSPTSVPAPESSPGSSPHSGTRRRRWNRTADAGPARRARRRASSARSGRAESLPFAAGGRWTGQSPGRRTTGSTGTGARRTRPGDPARWGIRGDLERPRGRVAWLARVLPDGRVISRGTGGLGRRLRSRHGRRRSTQRSGRPSGPSSGIARRCDPRRRTGCGHDAEPLPSVTLTAIAPPARLELGASEVP